MGLDKRARAEKKAAKDQARREYRRKEKELVRQMGGDTYIGVDAQWITDNGFKFKFNRGTNPMERY